MPKITPISARRFCRLLEKAGFERIRSEGDHLVYRKQGVLRPCVIPDWPELPVFIIKNNLRSAGITRDEYFRLLEQV